MRLLPLAMSVTLVGCATAPAPQPAAPVAAAPTPATPEAPPPTPTPPPSAPTPVDAAGAVKSAEAAIAARKYDEALADLAPLTDPDAKIAVRVLYARATALLYKRDFPAAARVFQDRVEYVRAHNHFADEAWLHNALTWVHWAEHDHAGALDENELVARAANNPGVAPNDRFAVLLHYWWDRAYLYKEDPAQKRLADEARKKYESIADSASEHDGLAVLAAFFAVEDGKGGQALKAAKSVNAAKDDDIQDLYVLMLAYAAGGDRANAETLLGLIRNGNEYPMKPVILQRIEFDYQQRVRP